MSTETYGYGAYHPDGNPADPGVASGWDAHWTNVLSENKENRRRKANFQLWRRGPISPRFAEECRDRMLQLKQLDVKRVLFPGNGLRIQPEFFRDFGCDVTALDLSPVATQYAETHPVTAEERHGFYSPFRHIVPDSNPMDLRHDSETDTIRANIRALTASGGTLQHIVGDFRDLSSGVEYDAVVAMNVLFLYPPSEHKALLQALSSQLRDGGVLLVQDVAFHWIDDARRKAFDRAISEAGFVDELRDVKEWFDSPRARFSRRWRGAAFQREWDERIAECTQRAWQLAREGRKLLVYLPT